MRPAACILAVLAPATAHVFEKRDTCPDGSGPATINSSITACCPGIIQTDGCVLGCALTQPACFPFCSDQPNDLTKAGPCTTVDFNAPDYTSSVYALASGAAPRSGSVPSSPASVSATPTAAAASASSSAAMTSAKSGGSVAIPAPMQGPMAVLSGAIALCAFLL